MAEMAKYKVDKDLGCGFMGVIFQCRSYWSRKSSVHSLPSNSSKNDLKAPINDDYSTKSEESKSQQPKSTEAAIVVSSNTGRPSPNRDSKHARKPSLGHPRPSACHQKVQPRRHSDAGRRSTSSSNGTSSQIKVLQIQDLSKETKPQRASTTSSAELSRKITDHQQANESKALVRATSSNMVLSGQLGNLRQPASNSPTATIKTLTYHLRNLEDSNSTPTRKNGFGKLGVNVVMGNIVRKNSDEFGGLSRNKLDPEVLKSMGNEAYKQGRFEEALAFYDRAIALDSNKAAYHSNKGAALIGLGRLIEAVFQCKEAIQIEPSYHKAHHRLATTYLR